MSRQHGKNVKVYLGGRDVSADLSAIEISSMADTEESTTFNSGGAHEFDPGLFGWEASITAFYQGQALGIGQQLESLLGAAGGIISVYTDLADAASDAGILLSDGVLTKRGQPIEVASLTKLTGAFKAMGANARPGMNGLLLHPLALRSVGGNSSVIDNGASSANGGRFNVHVTAATGTGGHAEIDHSTDNITFTLLVTAPAIAAAGGQTVEVAGTVNRYIRCSFAIDAVSSLTFVAGFARY